MKKREFRRTEARVSERVSAVGGQSCLEKEEGVMAGGVRI
jgi:hypothetical protein